MPITIPAGTDQFDHVQTIEPVGVAVATTNANQANLVLVRVAKPKSVTSLTILIGVSSGNVDVGIYSWDGTTATRLSSSGTTAVGTLNTTQTIALGATVVLVPGVNYFFALAPDNATASFGRMGSADGDAGAYGSRSVLKASSFPLPSTLTSLSGNFFTPWIATNT